jgi:hypothetical protein
MYIQWGCHFFLPLIEKGVLDVYCKTMDGMDKIYDIHVGVEPTQQTSKMNLVWHSGGPHAVPSPTP